MSQTQFTRNFRIALSIAEKKNFRPGSKTRPTQDGVVPDPCGVFTETPWNGPIVNGEQRKDGVCQEHPLVAADIMLT